MSFFTTWCVPCRQELQELEHFVEMKEHRKLVQIVGISVEDDKEKVIELKKLLKVRFPVTNDSGVVAREFKVYQYPVTIVIDRHGYILRRWDGLNLKESVELQELLKH